MISTELERLADVMFGFAAKGRAMEPECCAGMARALLDHAHTVAILETLPFDVTTSLVEILDALPEEHP